VIAGDDTDGTALAESANMLETNAAGEQRPPRSVSLFAPWRWFSKLCPWQRWAILVGIPTMSYIETPVLLVSLSKHAGINFHPVLSLIHMLWYPLDLTSRHFSFVARFYEWQLQAIDQVIEWLGGG
jgi:hypothetical protein